MNDSSTDSKILFQWLAKNQVLQSAQRQVLCIESDVAY